MAPTNGYQTAVMSDALAPWHGDDAPPTNGNWGEIAWNIGRMLATFRKRGPRGPLDGQPVLVIPGFLCSDQTTFSQDASWLAGVSAFTGGSRAGTSVQSPTRSTDFVSGSKPWAMRSPF